MLLFVLCVGVYDCNYINSKNTFPLTSFLLLLFLAGSTSSSASDHWLVRLTGGGSKRDSLVSAEPITGPPGPTQAPESPELPVFGDEPPKIVDISKYMKEHALMCYK